MFQKIPHAAAYRPRRADDGVGIELLYRDHTGQGIEIRVEVACDQTQLEDLRNSRRFMMKLQLNK
jgi:hypothetical protein